MQNSSCIFNLNFAFATGTGQLRSNNIQIYPNPVLDKLFIRINNNDKEAINFEIINIFGVTINKDVIYKEISIPVGGFTSGIYLLKIENDELYEFFRIIKE